MTNICVIANGNADDKVVEFISAPTGCTYNSAPIKFDDAYSHRSCFARATGIG